MQKKELRKKYKTLREVLSTQEIEDKSLAIANRLLQLPIWEHTYYHLFLSIHALKEIDTSLILHILHGKDKEIVVSKSDFKTQTLEHFLLTENTKLVQSPWGIPEPEDGISVPEKKIDVVFIPLLAFDNHGNRVGYGKGFYDGFLAKCKPETLKIGVSFFEAEPIITDTYQGDITLDYCITPNTVYRF